MNERVVRKFFWSLNEFESISVRRYPFHRAEASGLPPVACFSWAIRVGVRMWWRRKLIWSFHRVGDGWYSLVLGFMFVDWWKIQPGPNGSYRAKEVR